MIDGGRPLVILDQILEHIGGSARRIRVFRLAEKLNKST